MTNIYVRSTDGLDTDTGLTWALAKATIAGAVAIDTAGDTIFLSQVHSESTAGSVNVALAGTLLAPVRVLCGNDAAEPPTTLATTATITTTGASNIYFNGVGYVYGLTFNCGTGSTSASVYLANTSNSKIIAENCYFNITNTGSSSASVTFGNVSLVNARAIAKNCVFKFSSTGQKLYILTDSEIQGGSFDAATTTPAALFFLGSVGSSVRAGVMRVRGLDMSNLASTVNLINGNSYGFISFENCRLPAAWSGSLFSYTPTDPSLRAVMVNCNAGAVNYDWWIEDSAGMSRPETTLVLTGGATDGTTPVSEKIVTTANCNRVNGFTGNVIQYRNETTAVAKTLTVEILHDNLTALTDSEIYLQVEYLGSASYPLSSFVDDGIADELATPAAQASSTAAWTTTGLTNPNKQKLAVTFTPQMKGMYRITPIITKPSYTVYIDRKVTVA